MKEDDFEVATAHNPKVLARVLAPLENILATFIDTILNNKQLKMKNCTAGNFHSTQHNKNDCISSSNFVMTIRCALAKT